MIIKVILLGICVCLLNIFFRQTQGTFVIVMNLCFVAMAGLMLMDYAFEIVRDIRELLVFSSSAEKMFSCLYKGAIVCVLSKISSDICKDSGNIVVSEIIDLSGRIMLVMIAFPFIESITKTAASFL